MGSERRNPGLHWWAGDTLARIVNLFRKRRLDDEFDEEILFHLESQIEENLQAGMCPEEARRAAQRDFGGVAQVKEAHRDARGWPWVESLWQDGKFGLRVLGRTKILSAVAVISLALGLGVTTGIWTVINGVLLKPPPLYEETERLVTVWETRPRGPGDLRSVSAPLFLELERRADLFESVGAARYVGQPTSMRLAEYAVAVRAQETTAGLLPSLGVEPALGRNFTAKECRRGGDNVALLSHQLWERQFESDPEVLGRTVEIEGVSHTVVGVMPDRFQFWDSWTDIWLPLRVDVGAQDARDQRMLVAGRLSNGVEMGQVRDQLRIMALHVESEYPYQEDGWGVRVESFTRAQWLRGSIPPGIVLLIGTIGLALLIVCVNIANVMAGRSVDRQRETAVRRALGAHSSRLVRQFLTESVMLTAIGGILAVPVAVWTVHLALSYGPPFLQFFDFSTDLRVMTFMIAVVLATGLFSGLAPAWQARRMPNDALRRGSSGEGTGMQRQSLRRALVVVEVALTLTLVVGAGALIRTYEGLARESPGFEPKGLLSFQVYLPRDEYPNAERTEAFHEQALMRIGALAGVESGALVWRLPIWDPVRMRGFSTKGKPLHDGDTTRPRAALNIVSSSYFDTARIRRLRGELFTGQDRGQGALSAVISDTAARRFWPGQDPVGDWLQLEGETDRRRIIGVVADVRNMGNMGEPEAEIYVPCQQYVGGGNSADALRHMSFLFRTRQDPEQFVSAARAELARIDPARALSHFAAVETIVAAASDEVLMGAIAHIPLIGLGILLSALGIYGVVSYSVSRRTPEIGIRMALGAEHGAVLRMVIGEGLRLVVVGVILGLAAGFALTRLLASVISLMPGAGLGVFLGAALVLLTVGVAGAYLPARRAVRVDPMTALRYE